jgi:hypothetical protein
MDGFLHCFCLLSDLCVYGVVLLLRQRSVLVISKCLSCRDFLLCVAFRQYGKGCVLDQPKRRTPRVITLLNFKIIHLLWLLLYSILMGSQARSSFRGQFNVCSDGISAKYLASYLPL